MSFKRFANTKLIILVAIGALSIFLAACSSTAEKLNQDGNNAYAEQAYLEALQLYQGAQVESPELAEPYYNAANTFYKQGDYPAALEQMQIALQFINEEALAESSFFNIGNTLFNSQDLGTAIEAYKQALLIDPTDQDAKYNLELSLQQQEQQQQEQEQNENQDQQEQQENEDSEGGGNQEQDQQSQGDQDQDDQQQEGDQSESDQQQDGEPQDGDEQQDDPQPGQTPPPGQRMTEEQARQLLAAIAEDMQTLQEKLGQYFLFRQNPPIQDW